jgi:diguanylate cyclase (GGDEF)-like protein
MSRTHKGVAAVSGEALRRYELVMTGQDFAGNSLAAEYGSLLELCKSALEQAEASAWEVTQLRTQLKEMGRSLDLASRVDPMTGLANRRDIMEKIEQEHSRAARHQRTFSLIIVDIDDFRNINETHGINVGDDVLVEMACVLRECVRNEDICARWGGEEFLFLLPETGIDGALAVAQKIHQTVAMTEFKVNKPGIRTTVSLGLCNFLPGQTVSDCLKRAETALLLAKQSGKNRYVVAE